MPATALRRSYENAEIRDAHVVPGWEFEHTILSQKVAERMMRRRNIFLGSSAKKLFKATSWSRERAWFKLSAPLRLAQIGFANKCRLGEIVAETSVREMHFLPAHVVFSAIIHYRTHADILAGDLISCFIQPEDGSNPCTVITFQCNGHGTDSWISVRAKTVIPGNYWDPGRKFIFGGISQKPLFQ